MLHSEHWLGWRTVNVGLFAVMVQKRRLGMFGHGLAAASVALFWFGTAFAQQIAATVEAGPYWWGGAFFLLQIDADAARMKTLRVAENELQKCFEQHDVTGMEIVRSANALKVQGSADDSQRQAVQRCMTGLESIRVKQSEAREGVSWLVFVPPLRQANLLRRQMPRYVRMLHTQVFEGTRPIALAQGEDQIAILLPGIYDLSQARALLERRAGIEMRLVDDSAQAMDALAGKGAVPAAAEMLMDHYGHPLAVLRSVLLNEEDLVDVIASKDSETERPTLYMRFSPHGKRVFYEITRDNVDRQLALVLVTSKGREVLIAPNIASPIFAKGLQISGSMAMAQTRELAAEIWLGMARIPMRLTAQCVMAVPESPRLTDLAGMRNITAGLYCLPDTGLWE